MIEIADINLTNLCNARCPQCQRTAEIGLGTLKDLPMITWSLQDFMNYFSKETLDDIKEYSFCGTWGDPLMAKDIEPIVHYIMDNSNAKVIITTNGSIRKDDFYISKKLVQFTDLAYYKNGVADKVYYDSTLGSADTKYGELLDGSVFKYKGMEFYNPDSVFYFDNSLNFIGSVWNNL